MWRKRKISKLAFLSWTNRDPFAVVCSVIHEHTTSERAKNKMLYTIRSRVTWVTNVLTTMWRLVWIYIEHLYYMAQATSGEIASSDSLRRVTCRSAISVLDRFGLRVSSAILFTKEQRKETLKTRKNLNEFCKISKNLTLLFSAWARVQYPDLARVHMTTLYTSY